MAADVSPHVDAFSLHGTMKPKQRPQVTDGGGGPRTAWNPHEDLVWAQGHVLGRALRGGTRQGGGLGVAGCAPGAPRRPGWGPRRSSQAHGGKNASGRADRHRGRCGTQEFLFVGG